MKAKKFPLPIIIIIGAIVLISILTVQEYLSIIGWLFLSAYAVFPYLVYKIDKKKTEVYLVGRSSLLLLTH